MNELKTCFKRVDYDLSNLLTYIDIGDIGLPDIQRPFVWSAAKVRDLLDSMYRGFPVGYFLFWANASGTGTKQIGTDGKQRTPGLLIVDGQQRLTSLYAVFRGKKVIDENFTERHIEIGFRPRDGKFEVADAAIRRDPEWIPNVSRLWSSGSSSRKLINSFIAGASAKGALSEEEEERISHNLDRLFDLQKYPFTALEIAATVDEEQVADIFVRINSEGVKLNQADFILTLLSVFWEEGRKQLETFCRTARVAPTPGSGASPFNHFIQPDPDQLLRVSVALGFQRGRLKSVYQVLRGKDLETGTYSTVQRDQQFDVLREAQAKVLDLGQWHQFLSSLIGAGFRSGEMISSKNALLYAYAFYLIGRHRFEMPAHELQRLIGRWFFACSLTGRYTNSPETIMDGDLNRLKGVSNAADFIGTLEGIIANELTNDFWTVTLPANLDSSSGRSPEYFAYMAAQNRLGAPVLFSHKKVGDLLDPSVRSTKKSLERHHLFPRAWLERQGVEDLKQINQLANFALLEWPDNIAISDTNPSEYVPALQPRFTAAEWLAMHEHHALPEGWSSMEYPVFLTARRKLMADIIRRGFESLRDPSWPTARVRDAAKALTKLLETVIQHAAAAAVDKTESDGPAATRRFLYWSGFLQAARDAGRVIEKAPPASANWLSLRAGVRGTGYWVEFYPREKTIGAGLRLRRPYAKVFYHPLFEARSAIEAEFGAALEWDERPDNNSSYISAFSAFDPLAQDTCKRPTECPLVG